MVGQQIFDRCRYPHRRNTAFDHALGEMEHVGDHAHTGHYIAYVKVKQTGPWLLCNDERRTVVPEDRVLAAQAYVLVYMAEFAT